MKTKELITYLENENEDTEWICEKRHLKKGKSIQQNKTLWKIFTGIGLKLGYTKKQVRTNILTALFGVTEIKMFGEIHLVPNKTSTTQLNKEQTIYLIDGSLEYAKKIDAGIEITPREIRSLYDNLK